MIGRSVKSFEPCEGMLGVIAVGLRGVEHLSTVEETEKRHGV